MGLSMGIIIIGESICVGFILVFLVKLISILSKRKKKNKVKSEVKIELN